MTTWSHSTWILLGILSLSGLSVSVELETAYEWKYIDYVWETETDRTNAIDAGEYDLTKIIPVDFVLITGDRVLVTTPKYFKNPASLSTVSTETGDGGPLLEPYPSWDWHTTADCSGITSVTRVFLDECNRVWVVDSGKIGDDQICPAQILAFDSETDELLKRVEIPDTLSHNSEDSSQGRLEIQFVETKGDLCSETWVYIGDPEGYGLVIYDGSDIWRLENADVYAPESGATTYSVAGDSVTFNFGTAILTIPPPGFIDEDYLIVRPMSSFSDYAVKVEDLHNSKYGGSLTYYKGNITLPNQETARVISKTGVLIGALASLSYVACWHIENPLALEYVGMPIADDEALQFTSAVKIVEAADPADSESATYWLLTNRRQKFALETMDFDDTNFRIMNVNIAELVSGTICESTGSHSVGTIEDKFFFEHDCTNTLIV